MRPIIPLAIFAILFSASASAQTWDDHAYPDAGFGAQFPAEPQVESGTYETAGGAGVPATIYSVREGNSLYSITVADFSNAQAGEDSAIDDAVNLLRKAGEIKLDVNARINREFGRELTVAENDGSRSMLGIFFFNHRLYQLRATVMPPDPDAGSADALRFQQSLRFIGDRNGDGFGPDARGRGRFGPGRYGPGRFGYGRPDAGSPPPLIP